MSPFYTKIGNLIHPGRPAVGEHEVCLRNPQLILFPVTTPRSDQVSGKPATSSELSCALDLDVSKLPPKSNGSADSASCARRKANAVGFIAGPNRQRLLHRRAPAEPGSRTSPPARLSISQKLITFA